MRANKAKMRDGVNSCDIFTRVHASLADFLYSVETDRPLGDFDNMLARHSNSAWFGVKTMADALAYVRQGAPYAETEQARRLFHKVDTTARDRMANAWVPSVCGAYPVVPEALMGLPQNMRQRRPVESDVSPMRVIVEVAISQSVRREEIVQRGSAIAALVMRMSEERPVELHTLFAGSCGKTAVITVRLGTAVMNISKLVAVLASETYARALSFAAAVNATREPTESADYDGMGWGLGAPSDARGERLRSLLGYAPQDMLIQGGHVVDAAMMRDDPVAWVHKQLEKQRSVA